MCCCRMRLFIVGSAGAGAAADTLGVLLFCNAAFVMTEGPSSSALLLKRSMLRGAAGRAPAWTPA